MKIHVGDHINLDEVDYIVAALNHNMVGLHNDKTGETTEMLVRDLQRSTASVFDSDHSSSASAELATLAFLDEKERRRVAFWLKCLRRLEVEIAEEPSGVSEPYLKMVEFITDAGYPVSVRTLQRKLAALAQRGVYGLVDARTRRKYERRTDPRIIAALSEVIDGQTDTSTGTQIRLMMLAEQTLDKKFGPGVVDPVSERTMRRLINEIDAGRYTVGSARNRRSRANTPDRQHTPRPATRPGEQVQIDSTPFDVRLRMPDGKPGNAELTIMLDVACRTMPAAILRPTTKSIDLVLLLARALVPYDQRPGGRVETREFANRSFEKTKLLPETLYAADRERMPYIFPETLVTDRGRVFLSEHFEQVCDQLGISIINSASHNPDDKAKVERMFRSIATMFEQYFVGYTGGSVENRGTDVDEHPEKLHTIEEAQELLDQWIVTIWQNRPHAGLRDPRHPRNKLTPNEMYEAMEQIFPGIEIPFDSDTYLNLLPVEWLTVQAAGVQIDYRMYDSAALRPLRKTKSKHKVHHGAWPIHVDPYNIQTVWLRTDEGALLPLQWSYAHVSGPMSADLYDAVRRSAPPDRRQPTGLEIARRGRQLLEQAGAGGKQELKAAMRSSIANTNPDRLAIAPPTPLQTTIEPGTSVGDEPDPARTKPAKSIRPQMPRRRLELLTYTQSKDDNK